MANKKVNKFKERVYSTLGTMFFQKSGTTGLNKEDWVHGPKALGKAGVLYLNAILEGKL